MAERQRLGRGRLVVGPVGVGGDGVAGIGHDDDLVTAVGEAARQRGGERAVVARAGREAGGVGSPSRAAWRRRAGRRARGRRRRSRGRRPASRRRSGPSRSPSPTAPGCPAVRDDVTADAARSGGGGHGQRDRRAARLRGQVRLVHHAAGIGEHDQVVGAGGQRRAVRELDGRLAVVRAVGASVVAALLGGRPEEDRAGAERRRRRQVDVVGPRPGRAGRCRRWSRSSSRVIVSPKCGGGDRWRHRAGGQVGQRHVNVDLVARCRRAGGPPASWTPAPMVS